MKKAFTLIEVVISITIFMILILFLYKTLDQTKHSNKQFEKKAEEFKTINNIYNIFFEDLNESFKLEAIAQDRDKNSILRFKSFNTYHNNFYSHITYLINSKGTLVRIESKKKFDLQKTPYEFYNDAFIDELITNIEYFEVQKSLDSKNESYFFVIKQKEKKREVFNILKPIIMEIELESPN